VCKSLKEEGNLRQLVFKKQPAEMCCLFADELLSFVFGVRAAGASPGLGTCASLPLAFLNIAMTGDGDVANLLHYRVPQPWRTPG